VEPSIMLAYANFPLYAGVAALACFALITPFVLEAGARIAGGIEMASQGAASVMLSPVGALLALVAGIALAAARR
jgi:hypothetical protein